MKNFLILFLFLMSLSEITFAKRANPQRQTLECNDIFEPEVQTYTLKGKDFSLYQTLFRAVLLFPQHFIQYGISIGTDSKGREQLTVPRTNLFNSILNKLKGTKYERPFRFIDWINRDQEFPALTFLEN